EDPPELLQKVVPLIALTFIDIISRSYPTLPPPATSYRFHLPGTISCIRQYILPKFLKCVNLQDLDAVAYEEAHVIPFNYPRVIDKVEIQLCLLQIPVVILEIRYRA
ncbi:hypothetical protein Tco_1188163, partial [Tanacetum coccineum]